MKESISLLVVAPTVMPECSLTAEAKQAKEAALSGAALIGKVTNAAENAAAVNAHRDLKRISSLFEKQRKAFKEPFLEAGRKIDRIVQAELADIEQESGRIGNLVSDFALAEQRRVREEEELQRKELARIEAEKQAELDRIRREYEVGAERERLEAATEEKAATAAYAESRPVQATRETGQIIKTDWEIVVTNPYELAKYHPDCVKIEPLLTPIKAALNEGRTVKGITARKIVKAGVRAGSPSNLIEV